MLISYDKSKKSMVRAVTVTSRDKPATTWYCKHFLDDGHVIQIDYFDDDGKRASVRAKSIRLIGCNTEWDFNNSKGRSKAAGARCVQYVTSGTIEIVGDSIQVIKK